jgi:hypothetical protein
MTQLFIMISNTCCTHIIVVQIVIHNAQVHSITINKQQQKKIEKICIDIQGWKTHNMSI